MFFFSKTIIQESLKCHTVWIQPDRGPNCMQLFILNRRYENSMKISRFLLHWRKHAL